MVKVFNERAHPFDLSVKILVLLLLSAEIFTSLAKVVLQALSFVLDERQRLLQIDDLKLSLVLRVL